eukprot:scaffold1167_cov154-Isochrysis_galbana.AAC.5
MVGAGRPEGSCTAAGPARPSLPPARQGPCTRPPGGCRYSGCCYNTGCRRPPKSGPELSSMCCPPTNANASGRGQPFCRHRPKPRPAVHLPFEPQGTGSEQRDGVAVQQIVHVPEVPVRTGNMG